MIATWLTLARRADRPLQLALAGILLGAGAVLLLGAVATIRACSGTDTFCGDANVLPLLVFSVVVVGTGLLGSILALRSFGKR